MREKKEKINSVTEEMLSKGKKVLEDFDDAKGILITPKPVENKLISIRLPMAMIRTLRAVALMKGNIGYQQIIKTYIAEGLNRDHQVITQAQYVVSGAHTCSTASLTENKSQRYSESCYINIF